MSADQSSVAQAQLRDLPVDQIRPNDRNPRLIFPQDELDKLAESIDQEGILVPIVVFPKGSHFVLVDGERRYRCAKTLGFEKVPALITDEKSEREVLVQMFNIHLVREPWRDMPTARALARLADELQAAGQEATDTELRDITGLSIERVRQLRYVVTLPQEWQTHINEGTIPLNFFWELKRNVIDALARQRPRLFEELGGARGIGSAFVEKRIDGVITDTVGLRKLRPIINYAEADAAEGGGSSILDQNLTDLVRTHERSIDDVYEDTVQIMVEADKLGRRTRSMLASFERLLSRARTREETDQIRKLGHDFMAELAALLQTGTRV